MSKTSDDFILDDALAGNLGDDAQRIASTGIQWTAGIVRKNLDYGSTVWSVPCLADGLDACMSIRVRMSDKISRLQSLLSVKQPGKRHVKDESVEDTIADLGAYCLLYLARPRASDASGDVLISHGWRSGGEEAFETQSSTARGTTDRSFA